MAMLYTVCFVVRVFVLLCFAFLAISMLSFQVPLKMGTIGTWKPEEQLLRYHMDHLGP